MVIIRGEPFGLPFVALSVRSMGNSRPAWLALLWLFLAVGAGGQPAQNNSGPEMERLAKALAGDWETVETMQRSPEFPEGGSRHGVVSARLAAGGTTLLYEVHSDGSAGKLDGFLAIWWDAEAKLYDVFVCFNSPKHPCQLRGTAHWESDILVNDYDLTSRGATTRWKDSFHFTSKTHTLYAAVEEGGKMRTLITTQATRR